MDTTKEKLKGYSFYLEEELVEELGEIAKKEDRSCSAQLNRIIKDFISKYRGQDRRAS